MRLCSAVAAASFAFAVPVHADADPDTVCASVYALLAENARAAANASDVFDNASNAAQYRHLLNYPAEDPRRYALSIIDATQTLRQALAQGQITASMVAGTAIGCNARYFH